MANFRVTITSREMIKPASPTPNNKRNHQLSLIDQLATDSYIPILLFYQNDPLNNNIEKTSMLLKKSLSEALTDYYPLAGRIYRNELINCGDQGVEFSEAQAHPSESLINFLKKPSIDELQAMLPFKEVLILPSDSPRRHKNIVLSLQVTHFSCGGMAIGMCLHHKKADTAACVDFLTAWAAKAHYKVVNDDDDNNNHVLLSRPEFNGASLFPPVQELNEPMLVATEDQLALLYKERIAMRRVTFDEKAIEELKAQAVATNNTIRPSKVEVVNAFIFKHWPNNKVSSILQLVNLRKRMVPPVPEGYFGNCTWFARTSDHPEVIIQEFRKAIEKISGNYMKEFIFSDNFLVRLNKEMAALFNRPEEFMVCNSFSGFAVNEINFGMGKPIWACLAIMPLKNVLFTMSTKCGRGIEAWVSLLEEDVSTFDHSLSQLGYPSLEMPIHIIS